MSGSMRYGGFNGGSDRVRNINPQFGACDALRAHNSFKRLALPSKLSDRKSVTSNACQCASVSPLLHDPCSVTSHTPSGGITNCSPSRTTTVCRGPSVVGIPPAGSWCPTQTEDTHASAHPVGWYRPLFCMPPSPAPIPFFSLVFPLVRHLCPCLQSSSSLQVPGQPSSLASPTSMWI